MARLPIIGLLSCLAAISPALEGPAPLPWTDDGALAWAAVPSLNQLLNQVEETVTVFNPAQAAMVRMGLRGSLGAELVDSIDLDRTVTASLLPGTGMPPLPRWLVVVPVKETAPLTAMLSTSGTAFQADGDLLVIASDQAALDLCEGMVAAHRALPSDLGSDIALAGNVAVGRIMQIYGPLAQASLPMIPMAMMANAGNDPDQAKMMQSMGPILQAVGQTYLSLLGDVEQVSFDLRLGATPRIRKVVSTASESRLASVFTSPADADGWQQAWARLPDDGIRMAGWAISVDMPAVAALYKDILTALASQPAMATMFDQDFMGRIDTMIAALGNHMAGAIHGEADAFLQQDNVMAVTGDIDIAGQINQLMQRVADSEFGALYDKIGMPFDVGYEQAIRQSGGVDVHRLRFFGEAAANNPQLAMNGMDGMLKPIEVATKDGWYMTSHSPDRLDTMIAGGSEQGATLHARNVFGEGANCYVDYDYAFVLQQTFGKMMGGPAPTAANDQPVVMAMAFDNGTATAVVEVPLVPIRAALSAFMGPPPGAGAAPAPNAGPSF